MTNRKKKIFWFATIVSLSLIVVAYTFPQDHNPEHVEITENSKSNIFNVSANQFQDLISKGDGIILDVRTKGETNRGHLIGASFIDFYDADFEMKINLMQKDNPIYIYCQSGSRSYKAAQIMARNGFKSIYNLNGGIRNWNDEGMEMTKSVRIAEDESPELSLAEFNKMLDTDQVILVEFQTKWCAPCKKMAPVIADLQEEFKNKAVIIQIDADKNRALSKHFQLSGVPQFIVFEDKKETWRHTGIIDDQSLRERITK